ncbi:hypothetical protein LY12_004263 [Prauserella alba]|uniref:Uncharacterized protein n=1 Tax=Prauserella alba TaxID=176898 RepID=A0ABN1VG90_9PSEU|nr:hypothetical protein [Prauserella alba]
MTPKIAGAVPPVNRGPPGPVPGGAQGSHPLRAFRGTYLRDTVKGAHRSGFGKAGRQHLTVMLTSVNIIN